MRLAGKDHSCPLVENTEAFGFNMCAWALADDGIKTDGGRILEVDLCRWCVEFKSRIMKQRDPILEVEQFPLLAVFAFGCG